MDIVLNTNFNNPALPKVPLPGFYDDFGPEGGPPDSSLGVTSREQRPWDSMRWSRTTEHTALSGPSRGVALVDGYRSDGVLTATITGVPTGGIYGLAVRGSDLDNYIAFAYNVSLGYFLFRVTVDAGSVGGGAGTYTPERPPAPGDTLSVECAGDTLTGYFNDTPMLTATETTHRNNTKHGMYVSGAPNFEFNDIEFAPLT